MEELLKKPSFYELKKSGSYEWKPQTTKDVYGPYDVLSTEEKVICGRILKNTVIRTVDPAESNQKFKVSDFHLENLVAAGCDLVPCPSLDGDLLKNAELVQDGLISIDNLIKLGYYDDVDNNNSVSENTTEVK